MSGKNYFNELNSIPDSFKERLRVIESDVELLENIKTFEQLDFRISTKEIADALHQLKKGKASGLDSILAEMLKAGGTIPTPLLQCYSILYFHLEFTQMHGRLHICLLFTNQVMSTTQEITEV